MVPTSENQRRSAVRTEVSEKGARALSFRRGSASNFSGKKPKHSGLPDAI